MVERFYPEDFLVNDFAAELKRRGDDVEVLTQVPSYPFDRIFDGYKNKTFQTTCEFHGIPVHRVSTVFGYNRSVRRKILNYLHFAILTTMWAIWNGRRFDKVFVYHTAALTMASAAVPLRLLWRKPVTIWTQDLWPDAVWGFGFKPTRWKAALLNGFVRFIYANCTRITVSCRRYVARIRELTGREAEWIPQWEPADMALPPKAPGGKAIFMFAGNMGVPQNLENVISGFVAAKLGGAELWLVGGGVMTEPLVAKFGAEPCVRFCGRQPRAEMPKWFAQADALIISLTDEYSLTLPGKFQSYIKTGRPLLGFLNGDGRDFIDEFRLGYTSDPGDVGQISEAFRKMAVTIRSGKGAQFGRRAVELSDRMFGRGELIDRLSR